VILSRFAPRFTALVTKPARRLWPAKAAASRPSFAGAGLHDRGDVAGSQARRGDPLIALVEHATEDRALSDAGGLEPGLQGRDRARDLAPRDGHLAADAFLVSLGAPNRDQEALGHVLNVGDVERDELGAAERAGEAEAAAPRGRAARAATFRSRPWRW